MTHLKIIQNNTLADTEEVSQEIIQKLYDQVVSGDLDDSSEIKGRLHLTAGYRTQAEYLHQMFPNLIISADEYIIPFEDPKMVTYLNSIGVGSNGVITEADAAAATIVANSQNTEVTKFNELKYFTSITESRGGFNSSSSGQIRFYNWTALEEVDISNFTSLGHNNGYAWDDTFVGCTSLKKVTASNKLYAIGYYAFGGCTNLETLNGLDGAVEIWDCAFSGCEKLPQSFFQSLQFTLKTTGRGGNFTNCKLLSSINISNATTEIPNNCFERCTSLTSISMPSTVTTVGEDAFFDCSSLNTIDLSNIQYIKGEAFKYSGIVGVVDLPNIISLGGYNKSQVFLNCKNITQVNLGSNFDGNMTYSNSMFEGCSNINSVTGFGNVTSIGSFMFKDSNIQSVDFDFSKITSIGTHAFYNCSNLNKTIDLSAVNTIEQGAFYKCSNVIISNFPRISNYAPNTFAYIKNSTITIPKEVTSIGDSCFWQCESLQTLSFEQDSLLTSIGQNAFMRCYQLQSIVLPEGITTIDQQAFSTCIRALTVDIPSTVTNIGQAAFYSIGTVDDFSNITKVIFRGSNPPTCTSVNNQLFGRGNSQQISTLYIYVPDASVNTYKAHAAFSWYADRIFGISQMPNS